MKSISIYEKKLKLPKRRRLVQATGDLSGWVSHYGGLQELVSHAGLIKFLPVVFNATWQHGVIEPWRYQSYPLQLLYNVKHSKDRLILVIDYDQKKALEGLGYENVHSVGAPFIYAEPIHKPTRKVKSVLVMPPHTLDGAPFEEQEKINEYVNFIVDRYKSSAELVCASVHLSCIRNKQWAPEFENRGIMVVGGADHGDANSLKRMWFLFSKFDIVSTPTIGSHVFYALACGCKVMLEGPKIEYSESQLLKDNSHLRALHNGENLIKSHQFKNAEAEFADSMRIDLGNESLGRKILGFQYKRYPAEICELLSWSTAQQFRLAPAYAQTKVKNKLSAIIRRTKESFYSQ